MSTDPMTIEMPGIPGKLRSQTLDEYIGQLIPEHPARAELAQIRALALEGMKSTHKLAEALAKISELEAKLASVQVPEPLPMVGIGAPLSGLGGTQPPEPVTISDETTLSPLKALWPKAPCPYCARPTSVMPGHWAMHMKNKHSDKPFLHAPSV